MMNAIGRNVILVSVLLVSTFTQLTTGDACSHLDALFQNTWMFSHYGQTFSSTFTDTKVTVNLYSGGGISFTAISECVEEHGDFRMYKLISSDGMGQFVDDYLCYKLVKTDLPEFIHIFIGGYHKNEFCSACSFGEKPWTHMLPGSDIQLAPAIPEEPICNLPSICPLVDPRKKHCPSELELFCERLLSILDYGSSEEASLEEEEEEGGGGYYISLLGRQVERKKGKKDKQGNGGKSGEGQNSGSGSMGDNGKKYGKCKKKLAAEIRAKCSSASEPSPTPESGKREYGNERQMEKRMIRKKHFLF